MPLRTPPSTATHCPYCALQCGISVHRGPPAGHRWQPQRTSRPTAAACAPKGWTAADLLDHPERLLAPLVRTVPGDRTARSARRPGTRRSTRSPRGIRGRPGAATGRTPSACFGGGGLTNEKAYLLGKFARVALRTAHIDYNGRFCMSSAAAAAQPGVRHRPRAAVPARGHRRGRRVLLVGSNPADTMPPVMQYFDAGRERGAPAHRRRPAPHADRRAARRCTCSRCPGTDLALANGLLHIAIRGGLVDEEYIAERTTGFDASAPAPPPYWPDRVERITGVPDGDLRPGRPVAGDRRRAAMILTARGAEQQSKGTDTVLAFINLALALGLPGRPRSGYGTITGQGNGQGGREHGQKADQLPGYRKLDDPAARAHVAAVWGIDPDELPGPGLSGVRDARPDGHARRRRGRSSSWAPTSSSRRRTSTASPSGSSALDLLVVSDIFLSETAALADVVLPTAAVGRGGGHDDQPRRAGHPPPPAAAAPGRRARRTSRSSSCSPSGSAAAATSPTDPREVFDELRRASAGGIADYAGITYERIDAEQGVFWPCPAEDHPGTPRLFADRFPTPTAGRASSRVDAPRPAETPDASTRYVLTTGRLLRAVPVRHPDPPGRRAGPCPSRRPWRRCTRPGAAHRRHRRRRRWCALSTRRGSAVVRGPISATDPRGHRVRAVPLGRRRRSTC